MENGIMATIKKGYIKPKPPITVCTICGLPIKPVAYLDVGGWYLGGWDCDNYCNSVDDVVDLEWPFVEEYAITEDLETIGFITV